MSANWNCEICKGFGIVDCGGSRVDSSPCPRCALEAESDPDPEPDPVAVAQPGPFSVWHVHGDIRDPERAVSKGNYRSKGEAMVEAVQEADEHPDGSLVVYANNGLPVLSLTCPLTRPLFRHAA